VILVHSKNYLGGCFVVFFFLVVLMEAIFILIWLIVDPPTSIIVSVDDVNLYAIHDCEVQHPSVWYGLHFSYFAVVLIWGAYLAYQTRDIWQKYNYPNESRSILLSIYNLAFCGAILVPLVTALTASQELLFFLISVAIIFPTTFALVIVHGPKMMAFLSSSVRGKDSKNSRGGGVDTRDPGQSHLDSHTVRKLKAYEIEKEKSLVVVEDVHATKPLKNVDEERDTEREKSIVLEISPSPAGIRRIEEAKYEDEAPGTGWRVLAQDPASSPSNIARDSPSPTSAFDQPEADHPLFGNYPNQPTQTVT